MLKTRDPERPLSDQSRNTTTKTKGKNTQHKQRVTNTHVCVRFKMGHKRTFPVDLRDLPGATTPDLPGEGVHLLGELAEEDVLGGVGENQDDVHVSRPELHQVAEVGDVRQLRHLHEVLPGRAAEVQDKGLEEVELKPCTRLLTWNHLRSLTNRSRISFRLGLLASSVYLRQSHWKQQKESSSVLLFVRSQLFYGGRRAGSPHLKAWTTTVPNRMNKAEKMRDRRGIISRLQVSTEGKGQHKC